MVILPHTAGSASAILLVRSSQSVVPVWSYGMQIGKRLEYMYLESIDVCDIY